MDIDIKWCKISQLLATPTAPEMRIVIRRSAALLHAVGLPELRGLAIHAGYTHQDHRMGLELYLNAAREATYGEWLDREELQPHVDPESPKLLAELEDVVDALRVRAAAAVARHLAGRQRDVLLALVSTEAGESTRYSRSKTRLTMLDALAHGIFSGADLAAADFRNGDCRARLAHARLLLRRLAAEIRQAPLDVERRAYILADVMRSERSLADWFGVQGARLRAGLPPDHLERVGLGADAPAEPPRAWRLREFLHAAEA